MTIDYSILTNTEKVEFLELRTWERNGTANIMSFDQSDIYHFKWNRMSEKIQKKRKKHLKKNDEMSELCKNRDALAEKFNASIDFKEKHSLICKISKLDDVYRKHAIDDWKALEKEQKKVDAFYNKYMGGL